MLGRCKTIYNPILGATRPCYQARVQFKRELYLLRAMSVTVLTISTLSRVGSKMVPWHLSPGTASYQCLFHLKNKQKNRRFGFKRDEGRWENQYWGERFMLSLCQVLPGILSACPQPWTLHPAHWFHPHPLKPWGSYLQASVCPGSETAVLYQRHEIVWKNRNRAGSSRSQWGDRRESCRKVT